MMFRLATAFLICLWATGASAQTYSEVLADFPELTMFDAALTDTGLEPDLIALDSLSVFAPTNTGFDALDQTLLALFMTEAWELHFINLLQYHTTESSVITLVLESDTTTSYTMQNGEIVSLAVTNNPSGDGKIYTFSNSVAEEATWIQGDIFTSNPGVVHIIDNVLKPSFFYRDVIDLDGGMYSTVLFIAGLAGFNFGADTFTFIAPTNSAFDLLTDAQRGSLTDPGNSAARLDFLEYHLVGSVLPLTLLADGAGLTTIQGKVISISIVGGSVMVNDDATVVEPNILALNGITHGIDRVLMIPVLMIPEDTPQPTSTPPTKAPSTKAPTVPTVATIFGLTGADELNLSTLKTALETSGFDETLNDPSAMLTALLPTNAAFGKLPNGFLATLLSPEFNPHLMELLNYHVSDGVLLSSDLSAGQVITMLNGETVTYQVANGVESFNQALIDGLDADASNGVAHVILSVLMPSFTGRTVIDLGDEYSTLKTLIALADLEAVLRDDAWTFFAPTNTAFEMLDQDTIVFLTSNDGKDQLIEILTYHAVPEVKTLSKFFEGDMLTTAQGGVLLISVSNGAVAVNSAAVVSADILAINGVTLGIDTVLMPATDVIAPPTSAPSTSFPTPFPTLVPTPFATPFPTPFATPFPTPFATPFPTTLSDALPDAPPDVRADERGWYFGLIALWSVCHDLDFYLVGKSY